MPIRLSLLSTKNLRAIEKGLRKCVYYGLLPACLLQLCPARRAQAQNVQHTQETADRSLKSSLRVDPSTLGLSVNIPLGSYPGRAGLNVPVGVRYSSKGLWKMEYGGYYQEGSCCEPTFSANPQGMPSDINYTWVSVNYGESPGSGWSVSFQPPTFVDDPGSGLYNFDGDPCAECELNQRFYVLRMHVMMPDGSTHELRRSDTVYVLGTLPSGLGTYVAVDGSNLRYVETSQDAGTLYLPDGSRFLMGAQPKKYIDRNGNTLTYNSDGTWTDTLGRAAGLVPVNSPATPTSDRVYAMAGFGGAQRHYTFRYRYLADMLGQQTPSRVGDMNVFGPGFYESLFHSAGGTRVTPPVEFNPALLYEVELPTGGKYRFSYNEYGELNRVVYPNGGYERYQYAAIPGIDPVNAPYDQTNRGVTDVWVSATGGAADEAHTHYSVQTAPEYKVTAANPDGSYVERRLLAGRGPGVVDFGFDDSRAGMTYDERLYSPAGQVLERKLTEWSQSGPQSSNSLSATATRNPVVTKRVEIEFDSGGGAAYARTTTYLYDADLNVVSASDYDFAQMAAPTAATCAVGSVPAGPLLRTTETTYLVNDPSVDAGTRDAYRARNLVALQTSTLVREPSGAVAARAEIRYDEPAYYLPSYGPVTGWSDPATYVRGNATTARGYIVASSAVAPGAACPAGVCVETHTQFDLLGSPTAAWDARGNRSQTSYSPAYHYAYPTGSTTPAPDPGNTGFGSGEGLTTTSAFDFTTGLVTSNTDPNNKTTTFDYSDVLNRLRTVSRPDGGRTTYTYADAHPCGPYVETRTLLDPAGRETDSFQFFDGLGRPYLSESYDGQDASNPWLRMDTQYDSMGRVRRVSNAYRSSGCAAAVNPSGRWTTTAYDSLARPTAVTTADGASVSNYYGGNSVTVTDQAGRKRRDVSDALGRLTQVVEDPTAGGFNHVTSYAYDAVGNVRRVDQAGQLRFFMYDALSRLIRVKNPEQAAGSLASNVTDPLTGNGQWSLAYAYDPDGNVVARVDARDVTAAYAYDPLSRNTTVRYSDGTKDIDRHYDGAVNGKGRFHYFDWDGANNSRFDTHLAVDEYDAEGRVKKYRQHFFTAGAVSPAFTVTRSYDRAGNLLSQTYPSGRVVNYTYDDAGRVSGFNGNLGDGVSRSYASAVLYDTSGGVRQEQFGTQTPLYHKMRYNVRGQLYSVRLSTGADADSWNRGMLLNVYGSGDFSVWGTSGPDNNGNPLRTHHYVPNSDQADLSNLSTYAIFYQDYQYDSLNRLTRVAESNTLAAGAQYVQKYDYDRWGNRTVSDAQTWGVSKTQFFSGDLQATNRLYAPGDSALAPSQRSMQYDSAGNLTYDSYTGQGARVYDAENRLTRAQDAFQNWSTYSYDAEGRRVKRAVAGQEWWQVYGPDGALLSEYRAGAAPMAATKEYGYRNGRLLVAMSSGDDQRVKRFVTNLYYGALQRDPSAQELQDKSNQLAEAGAQGQAQLLQKAKDIARALFSQTTYETSPNRSDAQYVADLYYAYLQRAPDDSGLNWWAAQVPGSGRSNVCNGFEASAEFASVVSTLYGTAASDDARTERFVGLMYVGAYGRGPTDAELQQRRSQLNAAAQGLAQVQSQAEAIGRELFAAQVNDLSLPAQQFVANLYEGFLQRGPDAAGLSFWTAQAGTTAASRQAVLNSFATCAAARELSGTLYREAFWLVSDHLGTPRMIADRSGSLAGIKRHDYMPFGEELLAGVGGRTTARGYSQPDGVRQRYTSKERDTETGLDYFGSRYYAGAQGRFTTVDPYNIVLETQAASELNAERAESQFRAYLSHPQQWNRYSYVVNNPLKYVDPTGEKVELTGTEEERKEAFERIKRMVGARAARLLYVREENGHHYVDYSGKPGDGDRLAATSELGVFIADMIDSNRTTEFRVARSFSTKDGDFSVAAFGGAATVGAEESLNGNTQIFVHPDAGTVTTMKFGATLLGMSRSSNGRQLDYENDIVDAHEFGHAYGNMIEGLPLRNSDATNARAVQLENYVRRRHGLNTRTRH